MTEQPSPGTVLRGPVIGLGGPYGYAPGDLTSPAAAAATGEVPCLPDTAPCARPGCQCRSRPSIVELRVHGVGGAPAEVNLETPHALQVAGDRSAGFFRPWFPGRRDQTCATTWPCVGRVPTRREAYCWGRLNTASWSRALWLLLIAYATTNLAHWALPSRTGRWAAFQRALIRLIALTMTAATVQTASFLLVDVIARQALSAGAARAMERTGVRSVAVPVREGIALLIVVALFAFLLWLSRNTGRAYESWTVSPRPPPEADPSSLPRLSDSAVWSGGESHACQRLTHAMIGVASVWFTASMFDGLGSRVAWGFRIIAAGLAGMASVMIAFWPRVDRLKTGRLPKSVPGTLQGWGIQVILVVAAVAPVVVASVAGLLSLGMSSVATPPGALRYDLGAQEWLVRLLLGLCCAAVLAGAVNGTRGAFLFGNVAGVLLLFGAMISSVFAAAISLVVGRAVGTPGGVGAPFSPATDVVLPATVYAGGFAFAATLIATLAVAFAVGLRWRLLRGGFLREQHPHGITDAYGGESEGTTGPGAVDAVRRRVANAWATARLTDGVATVLAAITVMTTVSFIWFWWQRGDVTPALRRLATIGGGAATVVTAAFVVILRQSIVSSAKRKRFGVLWDVVTFWPRAAHPLAPPCYAERSVPELVARIRRLTGDVRTPTDAAGLAGLFEETEDVRPPNRNVNAPDVVPTREKATKLLLVGYSQGTTLSVAAVSLLPPTALPSVALLTLAAPVWRLYGRAFPAWFGPDQLGKLGNLLTDDGGVRWRNVVRRSDYIGGRVLIEPYENQSEGSAENPAVPPTSEQMAHSRRDPIRARPERRRARRKRRSAASSKVNRWILDPPVLAAEHDPAPPPIHRHSAWFPDPQTRPAAAELVELLVGTAPRQRRPAWARVLRGR